MCWPSWPKQAGRCIGQGLYCSTNRLSERLYTIAGSAAYAGHAKSRFHIRHSHG